MTLDWSVTWAPSNVSCTCLTLYRVSDSACVSRSWKRLLAIWLDRYAPTTANDVTASIRVVRTVRNCSDRRQRCCSARPRYLRPGRNRRTPVPTSRATRSATMRARRCQIRARNATCRRPGTGVLPGPGTSCGSPAGEVPSWAAGSDPCFVADTTHRQYNFRGLRVLFDLGPQALDMDVDQAGIGGVAVAPHLLQQQLPGEDLPRLAGQRHQEVELQRGQGNPLAAPADGVAGDVDGDVRDLQRFGGLLVAGAEAGAYACHQLRGLERLRHVVIGTGFQPANDVGGIGLGGQHDDGDIGLAANLPADLDAVHAGKHEVEQDKVGPR